jgi:uncharacterized protein YndB with AHSA1/START domain
MTSSSLKSARAVADVSNGILLASVEITSDDMTRWWGSDDTYRTTKWTGDVRVGGAWVAEGIGRDGAFSVHGEFLEVDPPHKLVQTWRAAWDGNHATTITYRLEPITGGTRVTLRHEGFGDRAESYRGHSEGWERVLTWLQTYLARSA